MGQHSITKKLDAQQIKALKPILSDGTYELFSAPHTSLAAKKEGTTIMVFNSGKCLVQGKKAEEWVTFVLEPYITGTPEIGYEETLHPEYYQPHIGIDESGKGDFFGPLVIAGAYLDEELAVQCKELGIKDSKAYTSDKRIAEAAKELRQLLKKRFTLIKIGPEKYNKLYQSMGNLNKLLAWGHARAIENMLDIEPSCPRAVSDQFGRASLVINALLKNGRNIKLDQMHRAESDPAVAAASILARDCFVHALSDLSTQYNVTLPKGASAKVKAAGKELICKHGTGILEKTAKTHFKTTQDVLQGELS